MSDNTKTIKGRTGDWEIVMGLEIHAQVASKAGPEERRELQWACALHEMGMMVSHHDHHRHSAYLLGHVDAPGFSQSQQRRIAELVLGQRGGLRKVEASLATQVRLVTLCSSSSCTKGLRSTSEENTTMILAVDSTTASTIRLMSSGELTWQRTGGGEDL